MIEFNFLRYEFISKKKCQLKFEFYSKLFNKLSRLKLKIHKLNDKKKIRKIWENCAKNANIQIQFNELVNFFNCQLIHSINNGLVKVNTFNDTKNKNPNIK